MTDKRGRAILLVLLFTVFVMLNTSAVWKWIYPVTYPNVIHEAAEAYQVDPYLVTTVIQIESQFDQTIVSQKGAVGMMQLMPETAEWIIERAGFTSLTREDLEKPQVNIRVGSWYLSYLQRKYQGNRLAVIAAYNAGPGNVDTWIRDGIWDGTYENVQHIPYGETRHYVKRFLYFYGRYQSVYPEWAASSS